MHLEYFYKDNRDYLLHQQVEIVEFEVKKVQRQLDLAMRKMHHLKQDLFYYVGMILGDLFVIFVTEMILNVGIMKNIGKCSRAGVHIQNERSKI